MATIEMSVEQRGTGTPVVLLHAFPLSSALLDALGDLPGYRLVLPDLRGFGSTPLGGDPPALASMADDVVALLDRLELGRVVVGGVSMGGYVTMELMRRAPDRLAGVVLIDTKAGADTAQARAGRVAMAQAVLDVGRSALDPMMTALLGPTTREQRPDVVARVAQWLDEVDPSAVAWAQRAMAERPDSHATLSGSGLPGAVLVGDEDALSPPADAQAMAHALGCSVRVVPGAGHLAVTENPDEARTQLVAALDELVG